MASVTGLVASRMLAIEAKTIVGAVVRSGVMYFQYRDGTENPNGVVVSSIPGPPGSIQSSPAGGDLSGSYPNPVIGAGKVTSAAIADGTIVDTDIATANKDGLAAVPSLRTLGTGAQQAAPGSHTHSNIPKFRSGTLSHTASAANAKTTVVYSNLWPSGTFTGFPQVILTPDTGFPEAITYYSVLDRSATGFSVCATRTSTTASNFHWIAMQA